MKQPTPKAPMMSPMNGKTTHMTAYMPLFWLAVNSWR